MALIRWVSTTGDGSLGASWEGGVVPGAGDIAYLDGASQVSWTTGLDLGVGVTYRSSSNYHGDIGSASAYLQITGVAGAGSPVANAIFNHTGKLYMYIDDGAAGIASLSNIIIGKPLSRVDDAHVNGLFGTLTVLAGGVTLDADIELAGVLNVYGADARVKITEGATLTGHAVHGGHVDSYVSMTPVVDGGTWVQHKLLTGLTVRGGRVVYDPVPFVTGNFAMNLHSGSLEIVGDPAEVFGGISTAIQVIGRDFQLIGAQTVPGTLTDYRKEFPIFGE